MDSLLVFSSFDLVAYLMVGLALFMILDLVLSFGFLFRTKWNTGSVTAIVIFAYLLGHLIAIPSRAVFETWAEQSCLGTPLTHLVPGVKDIKDAVESPSAMSSLTCETAVRPIVRHEYFEPASQDVVARIAAKSHSEDAKILYNTAFAIARHDPNSYERIDIFQRLSILFRNMAFVSLVAFLLALLKQGVLPFGIRLADRHLLFYGVQSWMLNDWVQATIFLGATIGLFDRYLFFHRLFALEVISAFAYAPIPIF
ncbi:MAG TPA: hypothetical protein VMF32_00220 [Xanthobacteraceae bacterium]|nr:hypothetical protein [Xanthobacteraceae bacterium]